MNVPKRIKVGPFLVRTEDNAPFLAALDGEAAVIPTEGRLVYDGSQEAVYLKDSVLHEVIHRAYRMTALNDASEKGREQEEKVVSALTPVLLMVIRDNPRLVEWLQKEEV